MKVGPYIREADKNNFDFYYKLAAKKKSPSLLDDAEEHILSKVSREKLGGVKLILASPQMRAIQTARIVKKNLLKNAVLEATDLIDEIPFDISSLDCEQYSSTEARKKFLNDFMENKLLESNESIKNRINLLIEKSKFRKNVLFVTHTFLIKLTDTLIKVPDLFEHPEKLKMHFDAQKRLLEHCEIIQITDSQIESLIMD